MNQNSLLGNQVKLSNLGRRGTMGEEGFKRVVARHSVDIEAAKLTRLFDSSK